jgi:hypothetical protein
MKTKLIVLAVIAAIAGAGGLRYFKRQGVLDETAKVEREQADLNKKRTAEIQQLMQQGMVPREAGK